ncbi:hypothetical protein [Marinobacterium sedimentorum]|uniref:hypothetical protein n=1 Tax=Marinobacterium sedimentorum TaxID=2927804 RepID=UPI0020C70BF7|nr:hypothetical protein [Marinobacterium sedimentorum]MCP8687199.1 hypothetical protein [Marinobacterium sedimentorum]
MIRIDETWRGERLELNPKLLALVQGLPWRRMGAAGVITVHLRFCIWSLTAPQIL